MRLGVALPLADLDGGPLRSRSLATLCRFVEDCGFDSVWVFDAFGRGFMLPDPFMALTVAATVTERVELGTGIVQLPLRNVAEVAHRALTLELLADRRFVLGVGPGSTEADFRTFDAVYRGRFSRFEQQWDELRRWMRDGAVGDRRLDAWPSVLRRTPLALAGWRGGWVERAATEASAWVASAANADDETLADAVSRYRNAGGQRAIVTNVAVGGDPAPALQRIGRLSSMGFDDVVIFDPRPSEERLTLVRQQVPT